MFFKRKKINVTESIDNIEKEIYEIVKPYGFRKYGRTLHRFVENDISQVINFQCGQSYRGETHLLWINTGIRVPESFERKFVLQGSEKKYYHEYECNIRSRLGTIEGKEESCYNLYKNQKKITEDIIRQVTNIVLPVFEDMNSRKAILEKRREYTAFDQLHPQNILLEEAMIYGHVGDLVQAKRLFEMHYKRVESIEVGSKRAHLEYLDRLAVELGFIPQV